MRAPLFLLTLVLGSTCSAQMVGPVPSNYTVPSPNDSTVILDQLMREHETSLVLEKYDLVRVTVVGADAVSARVRVSPDGTIALPLAGSISVLGLTSVQAQDAIANLLRDKQFVLDPAVTVDVLETPGRVVSISGEIKSPGVYPLIGDSQISAVGTTPSSGVRVLGQLIALAGGLLDSSSNVITLVRPSLQKPVSIPLGSDPNHIMYASLPLFSGDEIQVPHGGQAYIIGAVKKQGVVPLKNFSPTTVSQAISMADGIGYEAAENDARLVRTVDSKRVVYKVEVRKIIQGKAADVALQNDDILYIPTVAGKAALKSGAAGLIVSLASTYVYTHP